MGEVLQHKPLKIFILIGINDIANNTDSEVILKNYETIVSKIQENSPNTKIYIQSILPNNDNFDNFKKLHGKMEIIKKINFDLFNLAKRKKATFRVYCTTINS